MNIEFDAYKVKLNDVKPALDALADSLNVEGLKNELERLHAMQEAPGFWDDPEKSQKIVVQTRSAETKVERYEKMQASWDDLMTICEMASCPRPLPSTPTAGPPSSVPPWSRAGMCWWSPSPPV